MSLDQSLSLSLSQTSLQDFMECPRRFELNNLNDAYWPAAPSSPLSKFELLTELGNRFHQLSQQFFIGIDPTQIESTISDPDLFKLWNSFLPYGKKLQACPHYAEQILRIPFENHFLVAKFDLIVQLSEEEFLIVDWKTSRKKPSRTTLANRVQTFLYPFIFQQAGSDIFSIDTIPFSGIHMQYWYPLVEEPEEIFPYSEKTHSDISKSITDLVNQIDGIIQSGGTFPLTEDQKPCKYCVYRSFCERGHQTSSIPEESDLEDIDLSTTHFDLDLIKEIEF